MGKGSRPRPSSITREEQELRVLYFNGRIGYSTYARRYKKLLKAGLIRRSGVIIKA